MLIRGFLGSILALLLLIALAVSRTSSVSAQTSLSPVHILNCSGLLGTLNQFQPGNVAKIDNCAIVPNANQVHAQIEFQPYASAGPVGTKTAQWLACLASTVNTVPSGCSGGPATQTVYVDDNAAQLHGGLQQLCPDAPASPLVDPATAWNCSSNFANNTRTDRAIVSFGFNPVSDVVLAASGNADYTATFNYNVLPSSGVKSLGVGSGVGYLPTSSPNGTVSSQSTLKFYDPTTLNYTVTGQINGQVTKTVSFTPYPSVTLTTPNTTVGVNVPVTISWTSHSAQIISLSGYGAAQALSVPSGNKSLTFTTIGTPTLKATALNNTGGASAALALTVTNLPDLVPDLSGITVKTFDKSGKETDYSGPTLPTKLGSDVTKLVISGAKIKNIGGGLAQGKINLVFYGDDSSTPVTMDAQAFKTSPYIINDVVNIPAGSTLLLPDASTDSNTLFFDELNLEVPPPASPRLHLAINLDNGITESSLSNNIATLGSWIVYPTITPKLLRSDGQVLDSDDIKFVFTNRVDDSTILSHTPESSIVTNRPLSGPFTITVIPFIGGKQMGTPINVTIANYVNYPVSWIVDGLLNINIAAHPGISEDTLDSSGRPTETAPLTSGQITIKNNSTGQQYETTIQDDGGTFAPTDTSPPPPGIYTLVSIHGSYTGNTILAGPQTVNWNWPDPDQNSTPIEFTVPTSGVVVARQDVYLPSSCQTEAIVNTKYCIIDSSDQTKKITSLIQPLFNPIFQRLKTWPSYPASMIKEVDIGANPFMNAGGFYTANRSQNLITVDSRFILSLSQNNLPLFNEVLTHETFHLLDDNYSPDVKSAGDRWLTAFDANFVGSLSAQFNSQTGQNLWDITVYNCEYLLNGDCRGGYSSHSLISLKDDGSASTDVLIKNDYALEAFAEEEATVCTFKQQVINNLNNIQTIYQQKYGNTPSDLFAMRDLELKRLKGEGMTTTLAGTILPVWYNECLNN